METLVLGADIVAPAKPARRLSAHILLLYFKKVIFVPWRNYYSSLTAPARGWWVGMVSTFYKESEGHHGVLQGLLQGVPTRRRTVGVVDIMGDKY